MKSQKFTAYASWVLRWKMPVISLQCKSLLNIASVSFRVFLMLQGSSCFSLKNSFDLIISKIVSPKSTHWSYPQVKGNSSILKLILSLAQKSRIQCQDFEPYLWLNSQENYVFDEYNCMQVLCLFTSDFSQIWILFFLFFCSWKPNIWKGNLA